MNYLLSAGLLVLGLLLIPEATIVQSKTVSMIALAMILIGFISLIIIDSGNEKNFHNRYNSHPKA